jgi:acyl-CoA reductase-like NAD-dependent aldehyde dehydrogenase
VVELPDLDTWIGGRRERSAIAEPTSLDDPNTGKSLQALRSSSPEQVERAIEAAHQAHVRGDWSALGLAGRAERLRAVADAIEAVAEPIAVLDALNSGVPISKTRMFAGGLGDTVRQAVARAEEAGEDRRLLAEPGPVRLRRVPWGPTALILPWNAPSFTATKKLAYALVAGNPVVLKPSPFSPWSAELLMAAIETAGLPPGTVSLVLGGGDVGSAVCGDPRVRAISMTGSTPTGRLIAAAAAPHFTRLHLELGSNNPAVVRADADVVATARHLFDGMTKLNGQWCEAPRNVYVAAEIEDELVAALTQLMESAEVGPSLDEATEIGPMAYRERRDALRAQRAAFETGDATIVHAEDCPDEGWFFLPTLVLGGSDRVKAEVFGPMLTVEAVRSDDDAVTRANGTAGGLAAYVFGEDLVAAQSLGERLLGGEVKINGTSVLDMSPESAQSFFGTSGIGGHGDQDLLDFHSGKQVIGRDLIDPPL